jgi:hypothetical protein
MGLKSLTHWRFAPIFKVWDYSTMAITTADNKKRVVIPAARPGDIFDVQQQSEGKVVLVRLIRPKSKARMSRAESLRAIAARPLRPKMTWQELSRITR